MKEALPRHRHPLLLGPRILGVYERRQCVCFSSAGHKPHSYVCTGALAMLAWGHGVFIISLAAFILSLGTLAVKLLTGSRGEPGTMSPFQSNCFQKQSIFEAQQLFSRSVSEWKNLWEGSSTVMFYTVLRAVLGAGALVLYYLSIEYLPLKDAGIPSICIESDGCTAGAHSAAF
eukprot:1157627-Pelagomonas_calceolata.AAC.7